MSRVIKYDGDTLPQLPFSIYFIDEEGRVSPKQIFTVTRKKIEYVSRTMQLFIAELSDYVDYNEAKIVPVSEFSVN